MGCCSSQHAQEGLVPMKPNRQQALSMSFTKEELMRRRLSQSRTPRNRDIPSAETIAVTKETVPGDLPSNAVVKKIEFRIIGGFDPLQGEGAKQCQDDCDFDVLSEVNPTVTANGGNTPDVVCALFDGHGSYGRMVSHFCTERFLDTMIRNGLNSDGDPVSMLEMTMLHLHSQLKASDDIDMTYSGTTAIISLFRENKLHVANVGDSRAVLLSKQDDDTLYVRGSTVDHKVDLPEESKRITKMGGRIQKLVDEYGVECGPARAWLKEENTPGIAMSRSLGDAVAHMIGVISNAEVTSYTLTSEDVYLVMASDGIWEVFESDELAQFIANLDHLESEAIAQQVSEEALKRWNRLVTEEDTLIDDISVLVCTIEA